MDKYRKAFKALKDKMDSMSDEALRSWLIQCGFRFEDHLEVKNEYDRLLADIETERVCADATRRTLEKYGSNE